MTCTFFTQNLFVFFLDVGRLLNCSFKKKQLCKTMNKTFGKRFMCFKKIYFELNSCKTINPSICKIDILCLPREC